MEVTYSTDYQREKVVSYLGLIPFLLSAGWYCAFAQCCVEL